MARIRTIKPSFWRHEDLSRLPPETHMLAAALLNYADDEGYFNANFKLVKADCCPLREDSTNIQRGLEQLAEISYIRLGKSTDGKYFGHIINFLEHQRVDRPTPSKIREIDIFWESSVNARRSIEDGSSQEGKGKEGKGKSIVPDEVGDDCPHQEIINLYHQHLPTLTHVKAWTPKRANQLRARWREDLKRQNLAYWEKLFKYIAQSDFLTGKSSEFQADLEWITKSSNFVKIIEGKYENKGNSNG